MTPEELEHTKLKMEAHLMRAIAKKAIQDLMKLPGTSNYRVGLIEMMRLNVEEIAFTSRNPRLIIEHLGKVLDAFEKELRIGRKPKARPKARPNPPPSESWGPRRAPPSSASRLPGFAPSPADGDASLMACATKLRTGSTASGAPSAGTRWNAILIWPRPRWIGAEAETDRTGQEHGAEDGGGRARIAEQSVETPQQINDDVDF